MGRRRTAEDYQRAAEENGWVPGAHEEEDSIQQTKDDPSPRYKQNQQEALQQWTIFMSTKGVPASECLRKNCPLPTNMLVKDFARWYCKSRSGRLAPQPNDKSVKNILKKFFAGFQRITETEISLEYRKDVYFWIRNTLLKQGYSTTKKREKHNFDVDDLVNVLDSLWTEDDSVFIHEVMRDQITFLLLAYCFSGARLGAFLHNGKAEVKGEDRKLDTLVFEGLTWKDVHVYLFPLPDGSTEVVLKLVQRWVKNNKDPENSVLEIPTYEHGKLRFDITAFLLPLAFRDNVFIGISSPAELWDFRVPEGEPFLELRIQPSKLELPVLRTVTRHGGLSNRMLDDSTFRYYFQRIVLNAGYYGELTIHALRRAVANEVDKRATPGERNKLLGHASSDVGDRDYLSNITSVDAQAAFLREKPRNDHINKLRSVSTKRARGFPQALPAREMANLLNDPTATKLYRDQCQLRERGANEDTVNKAQRKYKAYLHWLKTRALARWKEEWLEDRYAKIVQARGRISHDRSSAIDRAQALFRVMPERARLAEMIKSNEPRNRAQRLSAVQDLLSLCTRNFEVMYRPGEEPVAGACPVYRCKLPEVKRNRADHIHACRRKEFTARAAGRQSAGAGSIPVQYCFLCFKWLDGGDAWEEHCRGHLTSTTPKWCAVRVYCHTVISPGFCPFCLNSDSPAAQRLKQWPRNCTLMAHVEVHVDEVLSWPACLWGVEFRDADSLRHHLSDAYGLWKAEWRMFGRKRSAEKDEEVVDPVSTPNPEHGPETRPCKVKKAMKAGEKFIEWSPPRKGESPDLRTSKKVLPNRTKAFGSTKVSQQVAPIATTFIQWSTAANGGASDGPSGQHGDLCPSEPAILTPSSLYHHPGPSWDSPSVTVVEDQEGAPVSPALLELPQQNGDESDGFLTGDSMDDTLWLEGVSWNEDSTTDPTSVSTPATDTGPDVFEDFLDPALFCAEASTSQPLTSEFSHHMNTPPRDEEDDLDLPSLEFLLHRTAAPSSSEIDYKLGCEKPTEPTLQLQGWTEVAGRDGTTILEELPDHEIEAPASRTDNMGEEQWLMRNLAPGKRMPVSQKRLPPTASSRATVKDPKRGGQARRPPKKRSKQLDRQEQAESDRDRERKEAETEWAQRGYPRIGWRTLPARLKKFSPALRCILKEDLPSFYRTELESSVKRKEGHRYRCMESATAGYYGPRGQQMMVEYIVAELGFELRRRAVTDRLLRTTGVTDYVITVLVPELAVMLVKEDMKACDETARQVLRESARLGETLHEDV